jgi:hypothetical protein
MKKLVALGILLALIVGVYGCTPYLPITQTQEQVQTQWQSQVVSQVNNQNVIIPDKNSLDVGLVRVYSRLVYPGEVITVPIKLGDWCSVISASPVALYTITPEHSEGAAMVQTLEATPTYDPIRHRMEFGYVPVDDRIDYWTEKAFLKSTLDGLCVLDNRAPGNGYTMVELTVYPRGM